jgi:predicted TIM-barrel fold metal-dependent hydrolase
MPDRMIRPARSADQLVLLLDEAGIDIALISAPDWTDITTNETPPYSESTRAVFAAAERYPERLAPLVRVNPNWREQSIAAFTDWARHPLCRGLKLHPQWDYFPVGSKTLVDPLLAVCEKNNLPVFFSCGTYPAAQPMLFMDLAGRWPKLKFGLVHAGLCFHYDVVVVVERCPNVFVVCTPQVHPATIQTLTQALGAARILFGSETPFEDPRFGLQTVRSLPGISITDKREILGESATRWLGFQRSPTG